MNVYKDIWLAPRETIEEFESSNVNNSLFFLPLIFSGLVFAFDISSDISRVFEMEASFLGLLFSIPIGIGLAFLGLGLIIPGLINLFGKIWKGSSTMRQMVNVCSISSIPLSLILVNQIVLFVFGYEPSLEQVNAGFYYILSIWSFGLLIIGVSSVQKFSYGIALLNILISYLPLLIIGLMRN